MAIFIALMAFGVAIFFYASTFPEANNFRSGNWIPGPAFFPQILAVVLVAAAVAELIRTVRRKNPSPAGETPEDGEETKAEKRKSLSEWISDWGTQNAIIIVGLMLTFPFLMERVGFAILGFVTLFIITWRLKAGLVKSLVFSAVAVTATIIIFRYIFYMDLPFGIWSPAQYLG